MNARILGTRCRIMGRRGRCSFLLSGRGSPRSIKALEIIFLSGLPSFSSGGPRGISRLFLLGIYGLNPCLKDLFYGFQIPRHLGLPLELF